MLDNNQCNSAWISVLIYIVLLKSPLCCANAQLFTLAIFRQWSLPYCTPGKHTIKCPVTLVKILISHVTYTSYIITLIKELLAVISVRCHIRMHWNLISQTDLQIAQRFPYTNQLFSLDVSVSPNVYSDSHALQSQNKLSCGFNRLSCLYGLN